MTTCRRASGVLLLLLLVVGCGDGKGGVCLPCWMGKDFSVAKSASDLRRLPPESTWVRARGVPDDAVLELARFQNLTALDLGSGSKALPLRMTAKGLSKISDLGLERLATLTLVASRRSTTSACARSPGFGRSPGSALRSARVSQRPASRR